MAAAACSRCSPRCIFWFPKVFGCTLRERLGKWNFWLPFIGFNVTFAPQFLIGMYGMLRRIFTYPDLPHWAQLNALSSLGAAIQLAGGLVFLVNLVVSTRAPAAGRRQSVGWVHARVGDVSPPPEHNFDRLPPIRSERPVFDLHHPELAEGAG